MECVCIMYHPLSLPHNSHTLLCIIILLWLQQHRYSVAERTRNVTERAIPEMRKNSGHAARQYGRRGRPGTTQGAVRAVLPPAVQRRRPRVQQDHLQEEEGQVMWVPGERGSGRRRLAPLSILGQDPGLSACGDGGRAGSVSPQQALGQ